VLSFLHPWLFLLLPLPLLARRLLPARPETDAALRVPFGDRIEAALAGSPVRAATRRPLRLAIPTLVWLLLITALARPQWIDAPLEKTVPTRDLLLLVDLSGSMDRDDFKNAEGEPVRRLEAVKDIVGDFLEQREGDRVGLVVFGDAPFLQAPFSTDLSLARELLDETDVGMAGPRTALGDAIGLGINLFEDSDTPAKTIIALTDGNDTKSQVPPIEAARIAADREIRIHTVAIGDPTTVGEDKLDVATLEQVAEGTGGRYFFAADREQLAGTYEELDRIETKEVKTLSHRPRHDLFHYPLAAALLLSLASKLPHPRRHQGTETRSRPLRVDPVTGELTVS